MKKVLVLVEGQTEETFVRDVLAPYLFKRKIILVPKLATTKRVKAGPDFKGGIVGYQRVADDLRRLLADTSAHLVTTLIDFYGLPKDFPGMATLPRGSCRRRVAHLEHALQGDIAHSRFLAHLLLHEFEALLFVAPQQYAWVFDEPAQISHLEKIRRQFASPEEINEGAETAPSKRLTKLFPAYQKTVHGPLAAAAMGVDEIRQACPHFHRWLERVEQ